MRIGELLLEYNRQKTVENYGDRIIRAFALFQPRAFSHDLPNVPDLFDAASAFLKGRMAQQIAKSFPEKEIENITIDKPLSDGLRSVSALEIPDIVRQRRNQIIATVLEAIESRDPTRNKQYVPWMLRSWLNNNGTIPIGNLNRFNLIDIFHHAKERGFIRPEDSDINQFKTYEDFEMMMREYDADEIKSGKKINRGEFREIYSTSEGRIIMPLDFKASDYYGRGTLWCTAGSSDAAPIKFAEYTEQSPLYIMLPKQRKHKDEKYQLHSATGEFTDYQNIRRPLSDFKQRFPDAAKFLYTQVSDFANTAELTDLDLLSELWKNTVIAMRIWVRDNINNSSRANKISESLKNIGEYDIHNILTTIRDFGQVTKSFIKINDLNQVVAYTLAGFINIGQLEEVLSDQIKIVGSDSKGYESLRPLKTIGPWIIGFVK